QIFIERSQLAFVVLTEESQWQDQQQQQQKQKLTALQITNILATIEKRIMKRHIFVLT
ncbi:unnamed protein product, partial [Ceratitis capitata]